MGRPYLRAVIQRTWGCRSKKNIRHLIEPKLLLSVGGLTPNDLDLASRLLCYHICCLIIFLEIAGKKVYSICQSVKQGTSEYPKSSGVTIPAGPPPWV